MKKIIGTITLHCMVVSCLAQVTHHKVHKVFENGKLLREYSYDTKGRLKTVKEKGTLDKEFRYDAAGNVQSIRFYEQRKLHHTDTLFTFTAANKIASFERRYPADPTERFTLEYDSQNRITKRRRDKTKGDNHPWEERLYTYAGNAITMQQKETSFGGIIGYTHVYQFDDHGNITSLAESYTHSTSPTHVITYDNNPRLSMPDDWIDHPIPYPANNYSRYQWTDKRYETWDYTYNKDHLVSGYTYFYQGDDVRVKKVVLVKYLE